MFVVTLCFGLIILFEKVSSLHSKRNPIPESFKFPIKRLQTQNNATKTNTSSGTPLYVEVSIFNNRFGFRGPHQLIVDRVLRVHSISPLPMSMSK